MRAAICLTGFLIVSFLGQIGRADEPAQEFLDALRDGGYYDVALHYLDTVGSSELVSEEFRRALPFNRAEILIASVVGLRDLKEIEDRLDTAQTLLDEYARNNQSIQVSARTRQYSGRVLSQRADLYFRQAESERLTVGEREQLYTKARQMLQDAQANLEAAKELLSRLLDPESPDAVLIDPEDPETRVVRKRLAEDYTRVTVQLPNVVEKLADTYPEGEAQRNQLLLDAAEGYQKVWDKYKRYAAGIQACIFAGRCNQKLGKHKEALERFSEVFAMGSEGPLKQFKKQAYVLAADSWQAVDPYPFKDVIFILEPVVRGLSRVEARDDAWLKVQFELARAKHARAAEIKSEGGPTANTDAQTMDRAAAKLLRNVARVANPLRDEARQLLSEWDVALSDVSEETAAPTTFAEALQLGRDYIAEVEAIAAEVDQLRNYAAQADDQESRQDLEQQLGEARQDLKNQANTAIATLDSAIAMAGDSVESSDINTARYLQSYAYFASGRLLETTVIGEYLLLNFPRDDSSKPASGLMVRSYSQLRDEADPNDREFENRKLTEACNEIIDRWPGSPEAGIAAATMMRLSLSNDQLQQARSYYDQLPSNYPGRGSLAMSLGRNLWLEFKRSTDPDPNQLTQAVNLMKAGVAETDGQSPNYESAVGQLMLIDALLKQQDIATAIQQLDAVDGPLDLIKQQAAEVTVGQRGEVFVREAYKLAIRVYLAAMRQQPQQTQQWVDRVNGVLAAMSQDAKKSGDPQMEARLVAVYQLIAAEMEAGFDEIKQPEQKQKFAQTMSEFLGSIEESSDDGKTVLWAGATLMKVANELSKLGLDQTAEKMFQQATSAFSRAESIGFGGAEDAEALNLELRRQRALALRGGGQYEKAVDEFVAILKSGKSSLAYQIDAAETLQQWGIQKRLSRPLAQATGGTGEMVDPESKRPTNAIWGWKKLWLATRSNEKFRDTYYLALYNIIEGRFEYGVIEKNGKYIQSALSELEKTMEREPDFSGLEKWKTKFQNLKQRIQAAR